MEELEFKQWGYLFHKRLTVAIPHAMKMILKIVFSVGFYLYLPAYPVNEDIWKKNYKMASKNEKKT